jgi:hypothetical protein
MALNEFVSEDNPLENPEDELDASAVGDCDELGS